jgi:hypothetical protein
MAATTPLNGVILARSPDYIKVQAVLKAGQPPELLEFRSQGILEHAKPYDLITGQIKFRHGSWTLGKYSRITTDLSSIQTIATHICSIFTFYDGNLGKSVLTIPPKLPFVLYHTFKKCIGLEISNQVCDSVSNYLTLRAQQAWEGDRTGVAELVVRDGCTQLTPENIVKLLVGWHRKHDRRLVLMLGLDYIEIEQSNIYPGVLFEKLRQSPYTVSCITKKKAKAVARVFGIEPNPTDILIGSILRALRKETLDVDSTCVSASKFFANHETYNFRDRLTTDYDVVLDGELLYLKEVYQIEVKVANSIIALIRAPAFPAAVQLQRIEQANEEGYYMDSEQQSAVKMALSRNFSIITGQAGTGKSTCIRALVKVCADNNIRYMCLGPTGKSCNVIRRYTGAEAITIHMLITFPDPYLDVKHWIIDEASMINLSLFYRFLGSIRPGARITLIGDPNQLPPIGWGRLFNRLIESECVPIVKLRTIYRVKTRTGELDCIIENSKRIVYWGAKQFDFVEGSNFKVSGGDVSTVTKMLHGLKGCRLWDFIVICPFRKGGYLDRLNRAAQVLFNSQNQHVIWSAAKGRWQVRSRIRITADTDMGPIMVPVPAFHVGDKVMMCHNNYELNVMNGTEGQVLEVTDSYVKVDFNDPNAPPTPPTPVTTATVEEEIPTRIFDIPLAREPGKKSRVYQSKSDDTHEVDSGSCDTNDLCLSFAITAHQAQGSQWKKVIYYIPGDKADSKHVTKETTYLVITRAEEEVVVVSSHHGAARSVLNKPKMTMEGLDLKLQAALPQDYPIPDDDQMETELRERIAIQEAQFLETYKDYGMDDDYDYD